MRPTFISTIIFLLTLTSCGSFSNKAPIRIVHYNIKELTTEKLTGRILSETENTTNVQSAEGRYQIYIH